MNKLSDNSEVFIAFIIAILLMLVFGAGYCFRPYLLVCSEFVEQKECSGYKTKLVERIYNKDVVDTYNELSSNVSHIYLNHRIIYVDRNNLAFSPDDSFVDIVERNCTSFVTKNVCNKWINQSDAK